MPTDSNPSTPTASRRPAAVVGLLTALLVVGCGSLSSPGAPAASVDRATTSEAPEVVSPEALAAADLSICRHRDRPLTASGSVDAEDFASRLTGTWELRTRTIQGLTIDTDSHFWFDLEPGTDDGRAEGVAMLVDYGNLSVLDPRSATDACPAHATVSAHWQVSVDEEADDHLSLVMDGEYFGSYGDFLEGVHATESATFYRHDGRYLAGRLVSPAGGQGIPDDVWDRIALVDGVLTYVSCQGRFIDRYVKVSDEPPRIDGLTLSEAWERRKARGATLEPVPVVPWWSLESGE